MVHKHLHTFTRPSQFHDIEWDSDQCSYACFEGRDYLIKVSIWCEGGNDSDNPELCSHRVQWHDKNNPQKPLPFLLGIQIPGYPGGKECTRHEVAEILHKQDVIPPAHFLNDRPCKFAKGVPKRACNIM